MVIEYDTQQALFSPTVDTAIYAAGDALSALETLAPSAEGSSSAVTQRFGSGRIRGITLYSLSGDIQSHAVRLWLFRDNPSASTVTANAPLVINPADATKVIATLTFSRGEGAEFGTSGAVMTVSRTLRQSYVPLQDSLYLAFEALGALDFVAASDFAARAWFERD